MRPSFEHRCPIQEKLAVYTLSDEPMVVALPSRHELARPDSGAGLTMKRLAGETCILYGPRGPACTTPPLPHAMRLVSALVLAIWELRPSMHTSHRLDAQPRRGRTWHLLRPHSLQRMRMDGIVYRGFKGPAQPRALLSIATRRGDLSAVVKRFLNLVRTAVKSPTQS